MWENNIKLIWWFIAAVEKEPPVVEPKDRGEDSLKSSPVFCSYIDALERLTFQMDRDMIKGAINLVTKTFRDGGANLCSPDAEVC